MAQTLGELMTEIQRIVLENTIDGGITWSSLWTAAEVHNYLNQRLARFYLETELVWQVYDTVGTAMTAGTATHDLPANTMVVKRVTWAPTAETLCKALEPV